VYNAYSNGTQPQQWDMLLCTKMLGNLNN
jgi:hypothetical protein